MAMALSQNKQRRPYSALLLQVQWYAKLIVTFYLLIITRIVIMLEYYWALTDQNADIDETFGMQIFHHANKIVN